MNKMDHDFFKKFELNYRRKSHGGEVHSINNNEAQISQVLIEDFSININPVMERVFRNSVNNTAKPNDNDEISNSIRVKIQKIYQNSFQNIIKYPDSESAPLKNILSSKLKTSPENIIIGAGAMDLMDIFCETFIKPSDTVLIVQPTFSEFEWAVNKCGGKCENLFREPQDNFKLNIEQISEFIKNNQSQNLKCIYLCNPNNPNGCLDNKNDLQKLIELANSLNIFVFLDESFIQFVDSDEARGSFIDKINKFDDFRSERSLGFPNLFICRSLTKFYGIPGLRLGYGIGNINMIEALKQHRRLWSVNSVAQDFMYQFLTDKALNNLFEAETTKLIREELKFMTKALSEIKGIRVFPSDVNFLLIDSRKSGFTAKKIKEELFKRNFFIRNCDNYPGLDSYYFRVCIKDRDKNEQIINALSEIIAQ